MNKKIEFIIYTVIFCLFGTVLFVSKQTTYVYYTLALWISFGLMLAITRYVIGPKISLNKYAHSFFIFTATFIALLFLTGYLYSQYLAEVFKVESVSLFEMSIIVKTAPFLTIAALIGFIHLVDLRSKTTKKVLYFVAAGMVTVIIGFSIKYFIDVNYKGSDSIKLVEGEYNHLTDVLNLKQFSDKVVYVDLWYSSCGACIIDFGELPKLKKGLENEKVEYLYLARETSHPNSFQLWKNALKKHNLKGWHVYMNKELENNVWQIIKDNTKDAENIMMAYPHYLIANRSKIISYNAERPGNELMDKLKSLAKKE